MLAKPSSYKLSVLLFTALGVPVLAQNYDLSWYTIDAGGGSSSSPTYSLTGTIGQPDAQTPPVMAGGGFELTGGFWPVANVCFCPGDLNGDGHIDGDDVQAFIACLVNGGECSCADVDQVGGVTAADVTAFVGVLLSSQPCS